MPRQLAPKHNLSTYADQNEVPSHILAIMNALPDSGTNERLNINFSNKQWTTFFIFSLLLSRFGYAHGDITMATENKAEGGLVEPSSIQSLPKEFVEIGVYIRDTDKLFANTETLFKEVQQPNVKLAKLRRLLKQGVHANTRDQEGRTPLYYAVDRDSAAATKLLLDNGADPNIADFRGVPPLHNALVEKKLPLAEILLERGADPNWVAYELGKNALHIAVEKGEFNIVALLLKYKADISLTTKEGLSCLEIAIFVPNNEKMIALLIRNGANIEGATPYGLPYLHSLAAFPHLASNAEVLIDHGITIDKLIDVDGNMLTELGSTVLANNLPMAKILLTKTAADRQGKAKPDALTPLELASGLSFWEMTALLLKHGAEPIKHPVLAESPSETSEVEEASSMLIQSFLIAISSFSVAFLFMHLLRALNPAIMKEIVTQNADETTSLYKQQNKKSKNKWGHNKKIKSKSPYSGVKHEMTNNAVKKVVEKDLLLEQKESLLAEMKWLSKAVDSRSKDYSEICDDYKKISDKHLPFAQKWFENADSKEAPNTHKKAEEILACLSSVKNQLDKFQFFLEDEANLKKLNENLSALSVGESSAKQEIETISLAVEKIKENSKKAHELHPLRTLIENTEKKVTALGYKLESFLKSERVARTPLLDGASPKRTFHLTDLILIQVLLKTQTQYLKICAAADTAMSAFLNETDGNRKAVHQQQMQLSKDRLEYLLAKIGECLGRIKEVNLVLWNNLAGDSAPWGNQIFYKISVEQAEDFSKTDNRGGELELSSLIALKNKIMRLDLSCLAIVSGKQSAPLIIQKNLSQPEAKASQMENANPRGPLHRYRKKR